MTISPNYLERYLPEIGKITENNKSIEAIFYSKEPQIALIKKEFGLIDLQAAIVLIVNDVLKFFNLGKQMNDTQVAQTVDLIIDSFPLYKLDDISLCFREAKKGTYGPMYDRIDGQVIMNWLYLYDNNKIEEIISIQERQKSLYKKVDIDPLPIDPKTQETINSFLKKPFEEKGITIRVKTPNEKRMDRWINQFGNLIDNKAGYASILNGRTFINIPNRKPMDISEFLSYKLQNHNNYLERL